VFIRTIHTWIFKELHIYIYIYIYILHIKISYVGTQHLLTATPPHPPHPPSPSQAANATSQRPTPLAKVQTDHPALSQFRAPSPPSIQSSSLSTPPTTPSTAMPHQAPPTSIHFTTLTAPLRANTHQQTPVPIDAPLDAVGCNTLQHTALIGAPLDVVGCNTLQHTALIDAPLPTAIPFSAAASAAHTRSSPNSLGSAAHSRSSPSSCVPSISPHAQQTLAGTAQSGGGGGVASGGMPPSVALFSLSLLPHEDAPPPPRRVPQGHKGGEM